MTTSNSFYGGEQSGPQPVDPRRVYDYDQPVYSESSNLDTNLTWPLPPPQPLHPLVESSAPNPYSGSGFQNYRVPAVQQLPVYTYFDNSDTPQQFVGEQMPYEAIEGEQYASNTAALSQQSNLLVDPYLCGQGAPQTLYRDYPATRYQAPVQAQPQPGGGDPGPSITVQQSHTSGRQKGKKGKEKEKKTPQKRAPAPRKTKEKDAGPSKDASSGKRKRKDQMPEEPAQSQGKGPGPSKDASSRKRKRGDEMPEAPAQSQGGNSDCKQKNEPPPKVPKRKQPWKPELADERVELKGGRLLLETVNQDPQEYEALKNIPILQVGLLPQEINLSNLTHIVLKSYYCEQEKIMEQAGLAYEQKYATGSWGPRNTMERACLMYNINRPFITWHYLGRILSEAFFKDAKALRQVTTCVYTTRELIVFSNRTAGNFRAMGRTLEASFGWPQKKDGNVGGPVVFWREARTQLVSNLKGMLSKLPVNEKGVPLEYVLGGPRREPSGVSSGRGREAGHVEQSLAMWADPEGTIMRWGEDGRNRLIWQDESRGEIYHQVYYNAKQDRLIPVKNLLGGPTP